jgi:hypothetical protein
MSNLISTSSIASGSIIYPEHVLRSIQALRGETDTLFILSGSLVVSASDVKYPNLLENSTPTALIAYNTSSGNFYWTVSSNSISPSSYISTGSANGNILTFTKGDNTTFDLTIFATGSSEDSLVTASISGTTLTFTKGDSSTFNLTIESSSYATNALSSSQATNASQAISASYAVTASYALNARGSGTPLMYQITLNMSGGIIDTGGTPIASVLGPNGENKATLEGLGWTFSIPTATRLTVGRPGSSQTQPLVNIMSHGNNSGNIYSRVPSGLSTGAFSAVQTLSGGNYTTLDIYSISNVNTGCSPSGATTVVITFGLIN